MIKSLFEQEEKEESGEESVTAKKKDSSDEGDKDAAGSEISAAPVLKADDKANDVGSGPVVPFEVDGPIGHPGNPLSILDENELEKRIAVMEAVLEQSRASKASASTVAPEGVGPAQPVKEDKNSEVSDYKEPSKDYDAEITVHHVDYVPDSQAETIRKTGMAYSAAIALFGSVVFMLIMGWFADLLLDIRPWGTVVGIVLGAVIGFMQLFQITSRIINPKRDDFERVSIMHQEQEGDTEAARDEKAE